MVLPVPTFPYLLSQIIRCFCFIKAALTSGIAPKSPSKNNALITLQNICTSGYLAGV